VIWHPHLALGIYESGWYSVRRVTQGYETWYKRGTNFVCLARDLHLQAAKRIAEQHAKGQI
jgi:hypothetical protein